MKTFYLLRLENGGNQVIFETQAATVGDAAATFNKHLSNPPAPLDKDGYAKISETVTLCVAEQFAPFYEV